MNSKKENITTENDLTRVKNDVYGNPRYVCHFLQLANDFMEALNIARQYGGKAYRGHDYGGGIVFQSYNTRDLINFINENSTNK